MTEPIEVPAPRTPDRTAQSAHTALPDWITRPYWTTSQACAFVAAVRDITPESARRWLGRNCVPVSRGPGREGENRYVAAAVKLRAPVNADGTLGPDAQVPAAELYHD